MGWYYVFEIKMCDDCVCVWEREMIMILNVAFDFVVLTETVSCVT